MYRQNDESRVMLHGVSGKQNPEPETRRDTRGRHVVDLLRGGSGHDLAEQGILHGDHELYRTTSITDAARYPDRAAAILLVRITCLFINYKRSYHTRVKNVYRCVDCCGESPRLCPQF